MYQTVTVTTDVSGHSFFKSYPHTFAPKATVNPSFAVKLDTSKYQNGTFWKGLLPYNSK